MNEKITNTKHRGFNKFWYKWVVQHNRRAYYFGRPIGPSFLEGRGACPPGSFEILDSRRRTFCILRSIFILL